MKSITIKIEVEENNVEHFIMSASEGNAKEQMLSIVIYNSLDQYFDQFNKLIKDGSFFSEAENG